MKELAAYRDEFPILGHTTYLINHSLGAMPAEAERRNAQYAHDWKTRGIRMWSEGWWDLPLTVGDQIGRMIGAPTGTTTMHQNVTIAEAIVLSCFRFEGERRRIVYEEGNFPSVRYLYQAQADRGAEIVVVPDDGDGQIDLGALARLVDERTKLIGLTWVPTSGGLVNPAAAVGRIARDAGALYLLDATQAVGQFPVDVHDVGCDLLTGTGRKFLRGPRGTGFLWVRDTALERLDPFVAEIGSATWDGGRGFTWADGARRFETWENSYVNIIGLGAAVQQALELRLDAIGDRTRTLGERLREDLGQLPGVTTHDLGTHRCAIVTAKIAGRSADDVAAALGRAGINVSTTVAEHNPLDTEQRGIHPLVRFSPHYYNTEAEIDRAVAAVAELASAGRHR